MPSFKPIGVPVAIDDAIVQCGRCAKDWGGPDERGLFWPALPVRVHC